MFDFKQKDMTIIGKDDVFSGKLKVLSLYVDGIVNGDETLEATKLIVGKTGRVQCDVVLQELEVCGCLVGNVKADKVVLKKGAYLTGNIQYNQSLIVEESSILNGTITKV